MADQSEKLTVKDLLEGLERAEEAVAYIREELMKALKAMPGEILEKEALVVPDGEALRKFFRKC